MTSHSIKIALRIPGTWANEELLAQAIPSDCKLSGNSLVLADGSQVELYVRPRDSQFLDVFKFSSRTDPTGQESERLRNYHLQVCLVGPGGSIQSASAMMRSAIPILKAGGAGVFVDNSALSFGASHWCKMADFCDADALTFGFVNVVRNKQHTYTVGMQVFGKPDLIMPTKSAGHEGSTIIDLMLKIATSDHSFDEGHQMDLPYARLFKVHKISDDKSPVGSPMQNPWGRLEFSCDRIEQPVYKSLSQRNAIRNKLRL
jgi:hypothetical protein